MAEDLEGNLTLQDLIQEFKELSKQLAAEPDTAAKQWQHNPEDPVAVARARAETLVAILHQKEILEAQVITVPVAEL